MSERETPNPFSTLHIENTKKQITEALQNDSVTPQLKAVLKDALEQLEKAEANLNYMATLLFVNYGDAGFSEEFGVKTI